MFVTEIPIEKKVEMYENGMLKEMTTDARVIEQWENEVYTYYYDDHKKKFNLVLSSLPFHIKKNSNICNMSVCK